MPREIPHVRQDQPALTRRWFQDEDFDLWTWQSDGGALVAFQLCYDKRTDERVLTWRHDHGFDHAAIDFGTGLVPQTPILRADGSFPAGRVTRRLYACARTLPGAMRTFIFRKVREYAREAKLPA
jgi:hypothetical protein